MSWGAQNGSEDAKIPTQSPSMSKKPELDSCPVQPYTASAFGQMVEDALNLVTYDADTDDYKRHSHMWVGFDNDLVFKGVVNEAISEYNTTSLPEKVGGSSVNITFPILKNRK